MANGLKVLIVLSVVMLVVIAVTVRQVSKPLVIVETVILFAFVVPTLIIGGFMIYRRRRSSRETQIHTNAAGSSVNVLTPGRSRSFSVEELKTSTRNFNQKIGQGGFGAVYFGCLDDGKEVAVKVLSSSSSQGVAEFLNEIDLLSKVNHKNLVSLLGYCSDDARELMLVYEYMGGESLSEHLYGSLADACKLDWKSRLQVALDAAEGLEYLHVSSTPKIIHRDVKSANILLDRNLRAKLADFGLSKIVKNTENKTIPTHMTTIIKGTVGYVDPEYFDTSKLTERSDVYSFGVVLLEIICGRKAIDTDFCEEETNLVKWVTLHANLGEDSPRQLTDIIDKRLSLSENNLKSFYGIVKMAIKCLQIEGSKRPTMSEIVTQIKEAMIIIDPPNSIQVMVEA
ncbi:hypothetical protein SUGI_0019570 [Cryptomeria japonica]|nr:hypothetical protein SUGI_0019570 [Cryptomeria japonica]